MHTFNPSTREAEAGESLLVQDYPGLHQLVTRQAPKASEKPYLGKKKHSQNQKSHQPRPNSRSKKQLNGYQSSTDTVGYITIIVKQHWKRQTWPFFLQVHSPCCKWCQCTCAVRVWCSCLVLVYTNLAKSSFSNLNEPLLPTIIILLGGFFVGWCEIVLGFSLKSHVIYMSWSL